MSPGPSKSDCQKWSRTDSLCVVLLLGLTAIPYWQVVNFDFVALDDRQYVTESRLVQSGLEPLALWDALFGFHADNWHPLVWWSLMADFQMFGNRPAAFHLVNLFWHLTNVGLLFVALRELTGDRARSLIVAAIFGIHPLHVESVAWVTERKDVLSGAFWMLCLWSYARWTRTQQSRGWWVCVTACLVLGLMAKQILVTLPCVFLLLDFWPLARTVDPRFNRTTFSRIWLRIVEKLPWFGLCVAASFLAMNAQQSARLGEGHWPLSLRLSNAVISVVRYLGKSFFPVGLSVQYPYDVPESPAMVFAAAVVLAAVTIACLIFARRRPALLVGWLWFLGTLVPVIGLIQVGSQSMADRYMYLPLIGLSIALVWTIPNPRTVNSSRWLTGIAGLSLATLVLCTARQTSVWRNTQTLYDHALAVDATNTSALYSIGFRALESGDVISGLETLHRAINWDRKRSEAREKYAGKQNPKVHQEWNRRWSEIYLTLGQAAARAGKSEQAITFFRESISVDPANSDARMTLGMVLADEGDIEAALSEFDEILRRNPNHSNASAARTVLLRQRAAAPK